MSTEEKNIEKDEKIEERAEESEREVLCCYISDPCGCHVDPCGCYVDRCCC
jgi:hypothetical protein